MITEALCGRTAEPPADPGRAAALAARVVGELAHRVFLDEADVRIAEFTHRLHQRTGTDAHQLDAVLRGLLGGPSPAVTDPLGALLVLGRGLVLELGLDEQGVAEVVGRHDGQASGRSLTATVPSAQEPPPLEPPRDAIPAAPPAQEPPSAAIPPASPAEEPPGDAIPPAPPDPVPAAPAVPRRSGGIGPILGGVLATFGVAALVAGLILPLGTGDDGPPDGGAPAPPGRSDPGQVAQAFADAINNGRFDRAPALLCPGSSSMTRHIARGVLRVREFSVDRVETRNSTTAYILAKAAVGSQPNPLVWRGTLRTGGGSWCVLDIHPEDDSPPGQPETRDVALQKMRDFVTLVSHGDPVKAMTYVCGTSRRPATQAMVDFAVATGARLTVKPDPGRRHASRYTGSVTGRSRWQRINGDVTISRADDDTYCISRFELTYK